MFLETQSMSGIFGDECFDRRYLEDQIQKAFLCGVKQGRSEGYDRIITIVLIKEIFKVLIVVESKDIMMDLMMEKIVVTRMDMQKDMTIAKKFSIAKCNKLLRMAIKTVMKKDFKQDMTNVKKNSMAHIIYC